MNSRFLKRFCAVATLALAGALVLSVGQKPASAQGASDEEDARRLIGTWNVTLKFPVCSTACPCPGGTPNIPIPALQQYQKGGSLVEVPGGTLFRGPGVGSWERLGDDQFAARFKFFIFSATGARTASEVVTSHINLTSPNAFDAAATFDLFDAAGNKTNDGEVCRINETATRFGEP